MKIQSIGRRKRCRTFSPRTSFLSGRRGLETLEPRLLLSISATGWGDGPGRGWDPPDGGTPPEAALTIADISEGGQAAHEFTVVYTDNEGVDAGTLDGRDILVTGRRFFRMASFVSVDPPNDNAPTLTATYSIDAPGEVWDTADNGEYTLWMQRHQVSDTEQSFIPSGRLGSFAVDIAAGPDETPPEAALRARDITLGGRDHYLFHVTYTDNVAVDRESIGDGDVHVIGGPGDIDQAATLVQISGWRGPTPLTAVYRIEAPGGVWDPVDNGSYTVVMQADEVSDTADPANFVAAEDLGTFEVNVDDAPDRIRPEAALSAADITTGGEENYTFTVEYTDNEAVDAATLDNRDILVTGRRFFRRATFMSVEPDGNGTTLTATYQIDARGEVWDAADNGTYRVYMMFRQVRDTNGNSVAGGLLGSFAVNIEPEPDTTPPEAALRATDLTCGERPVYTFHVTYTDDVAVALDSIGDTDVRVTDSNGFDAAATLVRVSGWRAGSPRTAVYQVAGPGGTWDATDDGTYTVLMQPDEVSDTADPANFVEDGPLGTFEVTLSEPCDEVRPEAELAAQDITEGGEATYQFDVVYTDDVAVDASSLGDRDVIVTARRFFRRATLVGVAPPDENAPTLTATYQIDAPGEVWDAADNGTYRVIVMRGQVRDTSGNSVASGVLGTFSVDIAPAPAPATGTSSSQAAADHLFRIGALD